MLLYQPVQNPTTFSNSAGDLLNELDASCESLNRFTLDSLYEFEADGVLQTMFDCDPASTATGTTTTPTDRVRCAADQLFGEFAFDQMAGSYPPQSAFTGTNSNPGHSLGYAGSTAPAMTFHQQQMHQQQESQQSSINYGALSMTSALSQSSMDGNRSYASNAASPLGAVRTTMACSEYSHSDGSYSSPPHTPPTHKPLAIYPTHPLDNGLHAGFAVSNPYSPSHDSMMNQMQSSPSMLNDIEQSTMEQSIKCEMSPNRPMITNQANEMMENQQLDLKIEDIDSALEEDESELDELLLDENSLGSIALGGELGSAFTPAFNASSSLATDAIGCDGGGQSSFASSLGFASGWTSVASNYTPTNVSSLVPNVCSSAMLPNTAAANRCDPLLGGFHHGLPNTPVSLNNTPLPPTTIATDNNVFSRTNTPLLNNFGNISPCHSAQSQSLLARSNSVLNETHQLQQTSSQTSPNFKLEPKEEPCERSLSQCSGCSYSTNYSGSTPTCAPLQPVLASQLSTVNSTGATTALSSSHSVARFGGSSFVPTGSYPFVNQLDQILGSSATNSPVHQSFDHLNFGASSTSGFVQTTSDHHLRPTNTATSSAIIRSTVNKPLAVQQTSLAQNITNRLSSKNGSTVSGNKHHHHQLQMQQHHQMNQTAQPSSLLCAVCGDSAACQHYGVRTCEGCKGFFKRTVQKSSKYVCLANRDCVVDKRRRNRCQFCRFQKCLAVGMVKEVVRTDSLKGRRGRLPSKAKLPQIAGTATNAPLSTIAHLQNAINELCPTLQNRKSPFTQVKQETSDCDETQYSTGYSMKNLHPPGPNERQSLKQIAFDFTQRFARKVPGFSDLETFDQNLLIRNASLEVYTLMFAYRNISGANSCWFSDCLELARQDCELFFGEWFFAMQEFAQRLQQIQVDQQSFVSLLAIALISERFGLADARKVELLQMRLIDTLRDHVTYNSETQRKPHYFSKLLSILPALRTLSGLVEPNLTTDPSIY